MPDAAMRLSAFAHLGLASHASGGRDPAHGIALRPLPIPALVNLRLDTSESAPAARVQDALGLDFPALGRWAAAGGLVACRLGPDEILIRSDGSAADLEALLREALGPDVHAGVTQVGEGLAQIEVSGPRTRAVLAKACPLDFHPNAFAVGEVRQSLFAKADCVYRLVADEPIADELVADELVADEAAGGPVFELTVRRSFADYVWRWLHDAALEYGVSVLEP